MTAPFEDAGLKAARGRRAALLQFLALIDADALEKTPTVPPPTDKKPEPVRPGSDA